MHVVCVLCVESVDKVVVLYTLDHDEIVEVVVVMAEHSEGDCLVVVKSSFSSKFQVDCYDALRVCSSGVVNVGVWVFFGERSWVSVVVVVVFDCYSRVTEGEVALFALGE